MDEPFMAVILALHYIGNDSGRFTEVTKQYLILRTGRLSYSCHKIVLYAWIFLIFSIFIQSKQLYEKHICRCSQPPLDHQLQEE